MSDPRAHAMAGALSLFAGLVQHRQGLQHERAIAELRAGSLSHLVDALVTKRIDAVQAGFASILGTYAEQARHFMAQQAKYADKELETTNPALRIELRSRIHKIDTELATLRADARLLYEHMSEVLLLIGGSSAGARAFGVEFDQVLALPPYTGAS